jgi:hypothetical protein
LCNNITKTAVVIITTQKAAKPIVKTRSLKVYNITGPCA